MPTHPLGLDEARELLGHEVVAACAWRGINLRSLDWNVSVSDGFMTTIWYQVIPTLDYGDPWPIWLPLFAHLLRDVRHNPENIWLHMGNVEVAVSSLLERGRPGATSANARLVSLLVLRIADECAEGGRIGPHNLVEIWSDAHRILQACLQVQEESRFTR